MTRLLPRVLFPALLAAIGLGWFGGQLGKWTDDYNIAFRDPVTGASTWALSWTPFRPLGTIIAYGKATWLWHHDTINHWISLGCHVFTALMLWRLLRAFVRRRVVADLGAMCFLVCPLNYEMVFWCASAHACLAVGLTIALMLVYIRYARASRAVWIVPLIILVAYAIPCLYEQPCAVLPAFPLLYFAVPRQRVRRRIAEFARAGVPVAGALLACAAYVWQLKSRLPGEERGGVNTIVLPSEWPERIRQVWRPIAHSLLDQGMHEFIAGSVAHGFAVLTGVAGWMAAASLLIVALVWLRETWLPDEQGSTAPAPAVSTGVLVTLFGLAMMVLPFAPIVAIREHGVATRMFYLPLAGLTLIATTWLDCILIEWIEPRRRVRLLKAAVGCVCLLAVMVGAVGQVGVQDALRQRFAMDAAQMRQLQSLVPSPPLHAIFVPLRLNSYPTLTGFPAFDDFAVSAFSTAWSSPAFVRHSYRREDLHATDARFGAERPLKHWSQDAVRYFSDQYPRLEGTPHEGYRLPFGRMIPFIVDWDGQVQLVDTVRVVGADNTTREIQFPLAAEAIRTHRQASRTIQVQDGELPSDNTLGPWRLAKTGQRLPVSNHVEWGAKNPSMTLHSDGSHMSVMEVELMPASHRHKLRFLMAASESDLRYAQPSGEIQLLVRLDQNPPAPSTFTFRTKELRHLQTWIPIEVSLPPQTTPNRLVIEVQANPDRRAPRIRLSPGRFVQ